MSLLPSTSHANPTTPFWATAGSGGGGGSAPIVIFGNETPVAWFKNFDEENQVLDIQNFAMPTLPVNGKIVVQANWNINSEGQDAIMYVGLSGSYQNTTDEISINASKGRFGTSLTMTYDYNANTEDWTMIQQLSLDSGSVDVGGTATMSVIFYPTP